MNNSSIEKKEKVLSEKNELLLTLGQASCLVLGLPPTRDNRKKAREMIKETNLFEVAYKRSADPLYPFVVGKQVIQLNPFLYNNYPPTPPQSSVKDDSPAEFPPSFRLEEPDHNNGLGETEEHDRSTSYSIEFINEEDYESIHDSSEVKRENMKVKQEQAKNKEDVSANNIEDRGSQLSNTQPLDRQYILAVLKEFVCLAKPDSVHKYIFTWITPPALLEIVKKHINVGPLTSSELEEWVSRDGFLGKMILKDIRPYGPQYGRYLYVLKQRYYNETAYYQGIAPR